MSKANGFGTFSKKFGLYLVIVIAAAVVCLFTSLYFQQIVLGVIIVMILGISWDILARTGQASFGQSTYFGLGVYCVAILAPHVGVVSAWIFSTIFAMAVAALFGMLLSKLKGRYFAISTLALSMAMQVIALLLPFTGGSSGISTTVLFRTNRSAQVILATILLLIAVAVSEFHLRPRPRTAAFLIRSNAYLASSSGIPVFKKKVVTFSVSGGIAALAGALYSSMYGFVLPEDVFCVKYNVMAIAVAILGGVDTSVGPLIGAILERAIEEVTKRLIGSTGYQLFVGLLIIVCVVVMPNGIVGAIKNWFRKDHKWYAWTRQKFQHSKEGTNKP